MKRKQVVPRQFRVATLMLAILAISILLAAPRLAGWTYAWYFAFLGWAAFAFAPSIALVGIAWGPWRGPRNPSLVVVACLALAVLSGIVAVVWVGSTRMPMPDVILLGLIAILVLFWPLQIVCFWSVWYFLFRKARR